MTCDAVRDSWPELYRAAEQAIREADDTPPGVLVLKQSGLLTLEDAKRIILAIQNEMTLEDFEAGIYPFVQRYVRKIEELW